MKTITIYKSYGVLAHEKQPFYSVGSPASDIYDTIRVNIPVQTWENQTGEVGVTLDDVDYLLSQVLTNRGESPVLAWFDGKKEKTVYLETIWEGRAMKYTLNDTTAYGIYNGLSEFDLKDIIIDIATDMESHYCDFDTSSIRKAANSDADIMQAARQHYTPYPVQDDWREEYKQSYRQLAEAGEAPGYGIVPDDLVYAAVKSAMQQQMDDTIIPSRIKKYRAIVNAANAGRLVSTREEAKKRVKAWNDAVNEGGYGYVPLWVTQEEYDQATAYLKAHE